MILLDASALVPLFIAERDSLVMMRTTDAIAHPALDTLARGEVAAAFARLVRERKLAPGELDARTANFADWWSEATLVTVVPEDIDAAADFVANPYPALRMPDAIHLAVAVRLGAPVLTLDLGMRRAADALGIATHPLAA